jgi:hypothetical protein
MAKCPICENETTNCVCHGDICCRCGQPSGSHATASRYLGLVASGQLVKPKAQRKNDAAAFLSRLALEHGHIVSTSALTAEEINEARNDGRMFVINDGLGFVIVQAVAPMKMLVDNDWLQERVKNDPDCDVEAGSAAPTEEDKST